LRGSRILVFGASGAIGGSVVQQASALGWSVTAVTRGSVSRARDPSVVWRSWDVMNIESADAIASDEPFDAVCWAQGANLSDSLLHFETDRHLELYSTNVLYVLRSAAALVSGRLLRETGARLVVVSSIWQERARGDKLSYTVTKSAIGGLVRSASVDLGVSGHLINAVLPGVLDTPMTRSNLTAEQVAAVSGKTTLGRLPDLDTLVQTILFLCSRDNKAISGQSITVDLGMSNVNLV
jgi:3-oxoacyl-[acyl-carrier protein] reductase